MRSRLSSVIGQVDTDAVSRATCCDWRAPVVAAGCVCVVQGVCVPRVHMSVQGVYVPRVHMSVQASCAWASEAFLQTPLQYY